jgi:hypothetical protein
MTSTPDETGNSISEYSIESDGEDLFVVFGGVKIAKRGHPKTPQAGKWVSLEPGFEVSEAAGGGLVVTKNGVRVQ